MLLHDGCQRFRLITAEQHRLEEAIREVIAGDVAAPSAAAAASPKAPAASGSRAKIQERHVCGKCKKELRVSYEGEPGEAKESAPVACPHCWATIHVEIGTWAVVGGDYSADKI